MLKDLEKTLKYADSKTARQHIIQEFIANKKIESQNELLLLLKGKGFNVTQTTLSRDLDEIGAKKITTNTGKTIYIRSEEHTTELQSH